MVDDEVTALRALIDGLTDLPPPEFAFALYSGVARLRSRGPDGPAVRPAIPKASLAAIRRARLRLARLRHPAKAPGFRSLARLGVRA